MKKLLFLLLCTLCLMVGQTFAMSHDAIETELSRINRQLAILQRKRPLTSGDRAAIADLQSRKSHLARAGLKKITQATISITDALNNARADGADDADIKTLRRILLENSADRLNIKLSTAEAVLTDYFKTKYPTLSAPPEQSIGGEERATLYAKFYDLEDALHAAQAVKPRSGSKQPYETVQEIHDQLEALLKNNSPPFFYADDLLNLKLRLDDSAKSISDSEFGKIFLIPTTTIPGTDITRPLGLITPLYQLVSSYQTVKTCGFIALANLYAIKMLVERGQPVNAEVIRTDAQSFLTDTLAEAPEFGACKRSGEFEEAQELPLITLSKKYGLIEGKNMFVLSDATLKPGFTPTATFDAISRSLRANTATFFLINLRFHWTALVALKQDDLIDLFYLDSLNQPITEENQKLIQLLKLVDYLVSSIY